MAGDVFLQDLSDEEREAWIKKAPVPVRNYIAYLEGEIEDLEESLSEEARVASFDDELGTLWTLLAARRLGAGDVQGFNRADRAARSIRAA